MTAQTMTDDIVELTVPADGAYLSVLRTATAGLAARLHFTLDEIEDLRIAVDEACALLLPAIGNPQDTELTCRFDVGPDSLAVAISAPATGALPDTQTFAWRVLAALVADVAAELQAGVATIRMTKRRASAG
ncbi:anti-sigma regulatory factor [Longispora fulva]|uniref:Serine/threonine-protein kinase RsbW n=1 Tax=Longispora fulva TaxID=619741 RepID=A0A8J7GNA1_9ACTN|nr:anti-sigma regulatory factor [Longispora fulva]MBG6140935.1 serine/threonine-protein kinase RsbW [Longispora fulva]GIG60799.1 anti-sigma regulatory factor [Longispora fulva]